MVNKMLKDWNDRDFLYCASCYKEEMESQNTSYKQALSSLLVILPLIAILNQWELKYQLIVPPIATSIVGLIWYFSVILPLTWVNFVLNYHKILKTYDGSVTPDNTDTLTLTDLEER